jgi:hypothetical protein
MVHSLNNIAAREVAKKKLVNALSKSVTAQGILPIWNSDYDLFRLEIAKSNISWLSEEDLNQIIYTCYWNLPENSKIDGNLMTTVGSQNIHELADAILSCLVVPNIYTFYFPVPNLQIEEDIDICRDIKLVKKESKEVDGGLLGFKFDTVIGPFIKVQGTGFVCGGRTQSAFIDALKKIKWILQVGTTKGYFIRVPVKRNDWSIAFGTTQSDIHRVKYLPIREEPFESADVTLGMGLSKCLSELQFSSGHWTTTKSVSLSHHVGAVCQMLDDPIAEINVKSIRRALEWGFDASIDEDEHMRFIKTCIGLEAAVADHGEDRGITEQLADRCAFLLAKTAVDRTKIRDSMRKIYSLRSKLVHGVVTGLSSPEKKLSLEAERMLKAVLNLELNAVASWYTSTLN